MDPEVVSFDCSPTGNGIIITGLPKDFTNTAVVQLLTPVPVFSVLTFQRNEFSSAFNYRLMVYVQLMQTQHRVRL